MGKIRTPQHARPPSPALPLGAEVALQTKSGTLYGAAAAASYLAATPGKGGAALPDSLEVDEWVQWSASTAAPAVDALLAASASGVDFPLDAVAVNAAVLGADEAAGAMGMYVRWTASAGLARSFPHPAPLITGR